MGCTFYALFHFVASHVLSYPMSVICEKYSVMRDLRCFALKANDVTCGAFSSPFYELILGGGFIRLPSFMRRAMRYNLRSDFISCSTLGAAE
jgi:hypothetical protein